MCGVVGFIQNSIHIEELDKAATIEKLVCALSHRGPDSKGNWIGADVGVALGHSRLAIIDTTEHGRQPMLSANRRYRITYNGEIYNHQDLGNELIEHGKEFRGRSDTEVLLAAIEYWGLPETLSKIVGMFAFALWDAKEMVLHLVRDRIGEKPLYYGWVGKAFVFASELKAFFAYPEWHGEIDRNALASYLRFNYIPAPRSIYRGIYKLLPGCRLEITNKDIECRSKIVPYPDIRTAGNTITPTRYWSLANTIKSGNENAYKDHDAGTVIAQLDGVFRKVIQEHQYADVKTGLLLSGGIDSSLIAALAQDQNTVNLRTFTVGFSDTQYNESGYAAAVAKYLGTDHTELHVAPNDALEVIESLPQIYDEPFADISQVPMVLISRLARKSVKVALSGDGGDEFFGGYNRYLWLERARSYKHRLPAKFTKAIARTLTGIAPDRWDRAYDSLVPNSFVRNKLKRPGESLHKFARCLLANDAHAMYISTVSQWLQCDEVIKQATEPDLFVNCKHEWNRFPDFVQKMMYLDGISYLPDDILVKVDRASMSTGLEMRAPFLDKRIVDFAVHLPVDVKLRDGQTKWLLRQLLYKYVPRKLIDRPKMGFAVPVATWLRGPLRDWAESLLDERLMLDQGFFDPTPVRRKWQEHLSGKSNWQYHLWNILMFQAWLEQQKI